MKFRSVFLVLFLFIHFKSLAKIVLPALFADNMVFQRDKPIPIWGKAGSREAVTIRFKGQQIKTSADRKGNWKMVLQPEPAGGPFEVLVFATDTLLLKNVLVGEVWVCSGQSNMEWTVIRSKDAGNEMKAADFPFIRHFRLPKEINSEPYGDFSSGNWQICSNSTVGDFTAVGYSFARKLYEELKVPIGLINNSWGGTNIETWISREAMENSDEFKADMATYPPMSMDSLNAILTRSTVKRISQIIGVQISPSATPFSQANFNDSQWPEMNLPGYWEQKQLGEMDGVVWFRKTVQLPDTLAGKKAILNLLQIEDQDVAYVNGVQVGRSNDWGVFRRYEIPAGVLKSGDNVIAVRVTDLGGNGGIMGESTSMSLKAGNNSIALAGNWKFQVESVRPQSAENLLPSLCYNSMVNPLISYPIKGVIWYQGESNVSRAFQYRKAFPLLIEDWRKKWNLGDFPFYFVQLTSYNSKGNSNEGCAWAELREAQTMALSLPNTGMCVTTDVGNPSDIHPLIKRR